jgi:PTS system mannose-specific IIB component
MAIVLARVDDRLLHGIVATQWAPVSKANRIMVIDDRIANNPVLKESMRLGKPAGVALSIINLETALQNFKAKKYDGEFVFVIASSPEAFLDLLKIGEPIKTLILGSSVGPQKDEKAIAVSNRAYVLDEQRKTYQEIHNHGTEIYVQYTPTDAQKKLFDVLK